MWSWPVEAGILGIGEVLAALRDDLILPSDAAPGLLRINGRKNSREGGQTSGCKGRSA